jgi:hypothetical protein
MRTVIFVGLITIADAVKRDWDPPQGLYPFLAIVLVAAIIMDLVEFIGALL